MRAILEELTSMSNPTTIHRYALKKMEPLNSAKSEDYGNLLLTKLTRRARSTLGNSVWVNSTGASVIDRQMRSLYRRSHQMLTRGLGHLRAPSEAKSDHVGRLDC